MNRRTTGIGAISCRAFRVLRGFVVAGGGSTRFGQGQGEGATWWKIHAPEDVRLGRRHYWISECRCSLGTATMILTCGLPRICGRGEGPLGGIITALLATAETDGGRDWNLIVSCDMPFLTSGVADRIWLRRAIEEFCSSCRAKV